VGAECGNLVGMPEAAQHRGHMIRSDRQMPDEETGLFLREHCVARVGTTDIDSWPYVFALDVRV